MRNKKKTAVQNKEPLCIRYPYLSLTISIIALAVAIGKEFLCQMI